MASEDDYDEDFDYGEDFDDENSPSQVKAGKDAVNEVTSTYDKYDPMNQPSYERLDPTTKRFMSKAEMEIPPSISPRENITPRSDLSSSSSTDFRGTNSSRKQNKSNRRAPPTKNRNAKRGRGIVQQKANESGNQRQTMEEQEAYIAKLQLANNSLRNQLKDFSRALDSSLKVQAAATSAGGGIHAIRSGQDGGNSKALRNILQNKEKTLAVTIKKLEQAKRVNTALKREVQEAYSSERMVHLTNLLHQRDLQIQQLTSENKSLVNVQRNQAREIERQEAERLVLPTKMLTLQEELRVKSEKIRNLKEKAKHDEHVYNRQHEQMVVVMEKNKAITKELKRYEENGKPKAGGGGSKTARRKPNEDLVQKLQNKISLLERSARQERIKSSAEVRRHREESEKLQRKLKQTKDLLAVKEKEMRAQVLEIKKMKQSIREIALGKEPLPEGVAPWKRNMESFQNDINRGASLNQGVELESPKQVPVIEDVISSDLSKPQEFVSPKGFRTNKNSASVEQGSPKSHRSVANDSVSRAVNEVPQETKIADAQVTEPVEVTVHAGEHNSTETWEQQQGHVEPPKQQAQPTPPQGIAKEERGPRSKLAQERISTNTVDDVPTSSSVDGAQELLPNAEPLVNEVPVTGVSLTEKGQVQQSVEATIPIISKEDVSRSGQNEAAPDMNEALNSAFVQPIESTKMVKGYGADSTEAVKGYGADNTEAVKGYGADNNTESVKGHGADNTEAVKGHEAEKTTDVKSVDNTSSGPVRRGSSKSAFAKPMMKKKKKKQVF